MSKRAIPTLIIAIFMMSMVLPFLPMAEAGALTGVLVTPTDATAGALTDYDIAFTTVGEIVATTGTITITFPVAADEYDLSLVVPADISITDDGAAYTPTSVDIDTVAGTVTITADSAIAGGSAVVVTLDTLHVKNPTVIGDYTIDIATSAPDTGSDTVTIVLATGTLSIDTTPVKGEVFVDGVSWGIAPQSKVVAVGTYTVSFGAVEGYITPADQTADVIADITTTIVGTYVAIPIGTLSIVTIPVDGEVFVDGVSWGIAPQSRVVDVGSYTVSFGAVEGYITPADQTAVVTEDTTTTIVGIYVEFIPVIGLTIDYVLTTDYVERHWGDYGDKMVVLGSGVTAGVEVELGWDSLKAWDGEKGILNSTEANPDGSFEVWFKVPEAVNGPHYLWVMDKKTGDTVRWEFPFNIFARIKMSPSSGLVGDKITLKGYGFSAEKKIEPITFEDPDFVPQDLDTSPAIPESDELGSWTATFKVPHKEYGDWEFSATDELDVTATADFTIGAAITLDVEEGPVGTVVEIRGRGFEYGVTIDTGSVKLDGIDFYVTDDDVVDEYGKFKIECVIPQVPDEGDYEIEVTDGKWYASADFEVLGLAEIELDPEFGVQGTKVSIKGYNFTAISGKEVSLEIWDIELLESVAYVKTFKTDADGEFSGTFTVPAVSSDPYRICAIQDDETYNIKADTGFRVGLMIVILSPPEGPTGTLVTLTGTGFTEDESWNATFNDLTLIEDGDVDEGSNLKLAYEVPTFYVPTVDVGKYKITVFDIYTEIEVEAEFEVTATTLLEFDPVVAPNKYNVTVKGWYFAAEEDLDLDFVLWNATDDWDMIVKQFKAESEKERYAVTNVDGNFTAWWVVPGSDTLSFGDYTINVTDEEGLFTQLDFSVVSKKVEISPRKAEFAIGEQVFFIIESTFAQPDSYIKIWDPDDNLVWRTDDFIADYWLKVGVIQTLPYYRQVAGGNPMVLLEDAPLGTWSWTWYDEDGDEIDSGTFTVVAAPAEVLAKRMEEFEKVLTGISEDVEGMQDDIVGLSEGLEGARTAADAARAAADTAAETISEVAEKAERAAESADAASESAGRAAEAVDEIQKNVGGLSTLVYAAIGSSLVAALAAVVSLMQISRRIAG